MNFLSQPINQSTFGWIIMGATISLLSGFLSSWFTYHFIKRKELLDTQRLEDDRLKGERIRQEVVRWANPILGSVQELSSQLNNILERAGYVALSKDYDGNENWSISYDYFMYSLLYLFGQYFAWLRMFQEELNFELFHNQNEKDNFLRAVHKVRKGLSSWPPPYACRGKDTQVFALQQRAIGELLIVRDAQCRRCMNFAEFLEKIEDDKFRKNFLPVVQLLDEIKPEEDARWKRLQATRDGLVELEEMCKEILRPSEGTNKHLGERS